jgi:RNA polymerase sigma factor (sigma-70 family)
MAKAKSSNMKSREKNSKLSEAYINCELSLKRFLSNFTRKPEDVDELAQETFLRAFVVEKSQEIKSPKAYLFRVARNITLRELTKKSQQLTDYLEESVDESILGREASLEEEVIAQQKLKQYCEAIAELPEQCRRVFMLRKVHALSHKEIAAQLDIATSTVEKHIAKGVERFTDYVEKQEMNKSMDSVSARSSSASKDTRS